jgi:hypothetical protein
MALPSSGANPGGTPQNDAAALHATDHAGDRPAPVVEVRTDGKISRARQPAGLLSQVVAHAPGHRGSRRHPATDPGRPGWQGNGHLAASRLDSDLSQPASYQSKSSGPLRDRAVRSATPNTVTGRALEAPGAPPAGASRLSSPRKAGSRLDAQDARGRTGAGLRAPKCAFQPQRPPPAGSASRGATAGWWPPCATTSSLTDGRVCAHERWAAKNAAIRRRASRVDGS